MAKIYVGNLSWSTDEESLRNAFANCGTLVDCIVMREPGGNRSRGFGFVTFATAQEAESAIEMMNDTTLDDRRIRVNTATVRSNSSPSYPKPGSFGQFAAFSPGYGQFPPGAFEQYGGQPFAGQPSGGTFNSFGSAGFGQPQSPYGQQGLQNGGMGMGGFPSQQTQGSPYGFAAQTASPYGMQGMSSPFGRQDPNSSTGSTFGNGPYGN